MFDTENSDMLPRAPPSPIKALSDDICKPTVPDVSIVMETRTNKKELQDVNKENQNQSKHKQSYAAWRKQMLPRVVYPASEQENFQNANNMPLNELYPLRPPINVSPLANTPYSSPYYENDAYYRRSAPALTISARTTTSPATMQYQQPIYHTQRRSLDAISCVSNGGLNTPPSQSHSSNICDVLTLCASTQTDMENGRTEINLSPNTLSELASKNDIKEILSTMQQMRDEQMRLVQICEVLFLQLQQQIQQQQVQKSEVQRSDATTQYENIEERETVKITKPTNSALLAKPKTQFQSPRLPPAAQSTAYQTQTPPGILRHNIPLEQRKPTDKTITMNELALKYLPNDKLNELMNDMHLVAPRNPMTERLLIAAKGPTDISNASYKYLKKYRLLPDEQNTDIGTPKNIRYYCEDSTHSQPNSPYEQRVTDSPILLRRPNSEGDDINIERDILNLEELRDRPKFM